MKKGIDNVREGIVDELKDLKPESLREVLDFIFFLKVKQAIDLSQAYFWKKTWQRWEKESDEDKRGGSVIGDGTVEDLLTALKT